jgi:hypothetical protein
MILCLVAAASAGPHPYAEAMERARTAIVAGDWRDARAALADAEGIAPDSPVILLSADLARLDYYRGAILWVNEDRDEALTVWRRSLTLDPKFQPAADVLPDTEGQDAYYALASEVIGYPSKALAVPDDVTAVIFVDGVRGEPDREVPEGRHFVQIRCDDGSLHGAWYTFGPPPPDYLVLCEGGAYPVGRRPTVEETTRTTRSGTGADVAGWSLLAAGAGLIGAGAYVNFAVVNPLWEAGQDAKLHPGSLTGDEAEELVADYDRNRWLVIGLVGAGVVAAAPGFVLGPLELEVTVAPSTVGLNGRW